MDPFDDVRSIAATVLKCIPTSILSTVKGSTAEENHQTPLVESINGTLPADERYFSLALRRAENMMYRTSRADYADGVGRLYDLTYGCCIIDEGANVDIDGRTSILENLLLALENDIRIAKKNLRVAVSTAPLHGRLIALR